MSRRVLAVLFAALLLVILTLAAWQLSFVLLLGFAGVLIAVLLRNAAAALTRILPISVGVALLLVGLALAAVVALIVLTIGPRVLTQLGALAQELPAALQRIEELLGEHTWGRFILERIPEPNENRPAWNVVGTITGTLSSALGIVGNLVVLVTTGIYLAVDPGLYRRGFLHLLPMDARPRVAAVLDTVGETLWRWLLGQFFAMAVVGVLTGTGLWLLGSPLPLALGIIAGLTNIIPYLGPFISAVPAIAIGLLQSPTDALYTGLLFLVVQQLEGDVLTPMIQKRATEMPPVLTILGVVGFGVLFGFMGVLLATPLLLVIIVCVRMLYVEDVLGDPMPAKDGPADTGSGSA